MFNVNGSVQYLLLKKLSGYDNSECGLLALKLYTVKKMYYTKVNHTIQKH